MTKKMSVLQFKKAIASVLLKIKNKKYVDTDTLWVCDRDPHENIKRIFNQMRIRKNTNLVITHSDILNALKKDLKNTEGK